MLTGELPGKRLEAPSKKVHIDVRLDEIVLRAMEKNPDLRFQQASVMKTRVDDLGTQLPKPEPPVVKRLSVAKILAIGCGVLALVLIVGLVGLGTVFWYRASELRESASQEAQVTEQRMREMAASAETHARQANDRVAPQISPTTNPAAAARVTGDIVLPKDFSEGQKERIVKASLALLDTCDFSEESSGTKMFNAGNGIAHIQIGFPEAMAGNHPDDMLITFPLTSGSVWTRRGNKYERHAKFPPAAAETRRSHHALIARLAERGHAVPDRGQRTDPAGCGV